MLNLEIGEGGLDANEGSTGFQHGELSHIDVFGVAWQQDRDEAFAGRELTQSIRQSVAPTIEFEVGDRTADRASGRGRNLDRDVLGPLAGRAKEELVEQSRFVVGFRTAHSGTGKAGRSRGLRHENRTFAIYSSRESRSMAADGFTSFNPATGRWVRRGRVNGILPTLHGRQ